MLQSFPPIADANTRILILGSMPGKDSIRKTQYYGHRRNVFWPIMGELYGAFADLRYDDRITLLKKHGVGIWDVIFMCKRESSLDSDIEEETIRVNNFQDFIDNHHKLTHIFFNGGKAKQTFFRYVQPTLSSHNLQLIQLPSTSPANARMRFEEKLQIWRSNLFSL